MKLRGLVAIGWLLASVGCLLPRAAGAGAVVIGRPCGLWAAPAALSAPASAHSSGGSKAVAPPLASPPASSDPHAACRHHCASLRCLIAASPIATPSAWNGPILPADPWLSPPPRPSHGDRAPVQLRVPPFWHLRGESLRL